VTVEPKL